MKRISIMVIEICLLLLSQIQTQTQAQAQMPDKIILKKIHEPVENAFTILKPDGWLMEGGIVRWDPIASGGAANAIEAKIDFSLQRDKSGSVRIHWLPDIYFADLTGSPVAGMFSEGSFYNGMPVMRKLTARTFLQNHLVTFLHPGASIQSIDLRVLPEIEKLFYDLDPVKQMGSIYSAAVFDYTYNESGIRFRERAFCVIQDMGPYTAGMWKNRNTVVVRAPESTFGSWEALFLEIGESVVLNADWIAGELQGQKQRGNTMIRTVQDIARIGEEIQKGHAETTAKINHQAYLHLTNQEDYINPHTQKVERGSNQWDHRWVDDLGNIIYTNDQSYNPNLDLELQMDGFQRSRIKREVP